MIVGSPQPDDWLCYQFGVNAYDYPDDTYPDPSDIPLRRNLGPSYAVLADGTTSSFQTAQPLAVGTLIQFIFGLDSGQAAKILTILPDPATYPPPYTVTLATALTDLIKTGDLFSVCLPFFPADEEYRFEGAWGTRTPPSQGTLSVRRMPSPSAPCHYEWKNNLLVGARFTLAQTTYSGMLWVSLHDIDGIELKTARNPITVTVNMMTSSSFSSATLGDWTYDSIVGSPVPITTARNIYGVQVYMLDYADLTYVSLNVMLWAHPRPETVWYSKEAP